MVAAGALLLAGSAATAQVIRPMPLQLRIEGYVGAAPAGPALADWTVDVRGVQYALTVVRLEPIGADVAYWTILNALEPLPVALTVFGSDDLLRRFTGTPAGQLVALTGAFELRRGPASLLLGAVDPIDTPRPVATGGSPAATAATPGATTSPARRRR